MAPRTVHVHIGAAKTGTTFIQRVLWANRSKLSTDGILLPGERHASQGKAARELKKWQPKESPGLPPAWADIVGRIDSSRSDSVIISQEFLSWLDDDQATHMVASLSKHDVKIVLTTRDLKRLIPAQWQSAMAQRNSWTLTEYAAAAAGLGPQGTDDPAFAHFWKRQDYVAILNRWSSLVGLDNVVVVTVPPSGSDPDELWRRFCQACELDPTRYETGGVSNPSLGRSSAEVLRRLNATKPVRTMDRKVYGKVVNGLISDKVMSSRRGQEGGLTVPDEQWDWVMERAEQLVADLRAIGPRVIGDLDELRPTSFDTKYEAPEDTPDDELFAAALDVIAGLAEIEARGYIRRERKMAGRLRTLRRRPGRDKAGK